MKSEIEIEFKTPIHAAKALKIIRAKEFSDKVSASLSVKGNAFRAKVEGKNFAVLRARTTSLLRDLKVVFDAISLVEHDKVKKKK